MQWIKATQRLPKKEGYHHVSNGYMFYSPTKKMFISDANYISPKTANEWLDESPSPTTDLSKVFDENADVIAAYEINISPRTMSKPRFISTVEKLLDAKTVDEKPKRSISDLTDEECLQGAKELGIAGHNKEEIIYDFRSALYSLPHWKQLFSYFKSINVKI